MTAPEGWDQQALRVVQKALAAELGPLARVLVRKAVSRQADREGLLGELAKAIEDPAGRRRFMSAVAGLDLRSLPTGPSPATGPAAGPATGPGTGSATDGFSDATLAELEQALAMYLGPLARVLVKKAARRSDSLAELHRQLAAELEAEKDRHDFLRRVDSLA